MLHQLDPPINSLPPTATRLARTHRRPAVGTAIEFWKVTRAFDVSLMQTFPFVSIKDKASYKDSRHNTNKHDAEAMRYLSYALYPCVIGAPRAQRGGAHLIVFWRRRGGLMRVPTRRARFASCKGGTSPPAMLSTALLVMRLHLHTSPFCPSPSPRPPPPPCRRLQCVRAAV